MKWKCGYIEQLIYHPLEVITGKRIPEILDFPFMITSNLTNLWDIFLP